MTSERWAESRGTNHQAGEIDGAHSKGRTLSSAWTWQAEGLQELFRRELNVWLCSSEGRAVEGPGSRTVHNSLARPIHTLFAVKGRSTVKGKQRGDG